MIRRIVLAACLLLMGFSHDCMAGRAGREPFNFLFLDADARAAAMAGAYTALATDANALLYNPAGLGKANGYDAVFMHNRFVLDVSQQYVGFSAPQGWGLSANHLDFGDIPRTTISNPDGSGSAFGIRSMAFSLGYGMPIGKFLSIGAGVKYLQETIAGISASGYAVDFGVMLEASRTRGLSLGAAVQNLGPAVRFQVEEEKLPMNLRFGAAYRYSLLDLPSTLSFEISRQRDENPLFAIGFEVVAVHGRIPVRAGFSSRNAAGSGVTFGIGWIHSQHLRFQYAFVPFGELGHAQRVSVGVRWGGATEPPRPPIILQGEGNSPSAAVDVNFMRVEAYIMNGEFAQAKLLLQDAVALLHENDSRWVYYFERVGRIAYLQGELKTALAAYEYAIERAKALGAGGRHVADAYAGTGLCLVDQGNPKEALLYFYKGMDAGPSPGTERMLRRQLNLKD